MADSRAEKTNNSSGNSPLKSPFRKESELPPEATRCERCGDVFPSERLRNLHRGMEHYDKLDESEREAFDTAYLAESEDLKSFRLRALGALVTLYFGFLFLYAVFSVA